ncbi:MAG: hypothetical protein MHM6MM_006702 [Cercozoa sp. M6MM]
MSAEEHKEEFVDFDDDDVPTGEQESSSAAAGDEGVPKGSHAGVQARSFKELLLKPELLSALADCGFEHPSEVQQQAIREAIFNTDIIAQAKSGMGKTAVFVLTTLHLLEVSADETNNDVDTVVLCHNRELAFQICQEFERFAKHMPHVKIAVFFGGVPVKDHVDKLKQETPHIVVGTPGRVFDLIERGALKVDKVKRFVLDECDQMLTEDNMRSMVQRIFMATPQSKQVMLFSATISPEARKICLKFTHNPLKIFIDDEKKLTLHGLQQYYVELPEKDKTSKLNDILGSLEYNQVVIFVSKVARCKQLDRLLQECGYPSMAIHSRMKQSERIDRYNRFKRYESRILVSTDIWGRGVDVEKVNVVVNFDMPTAADQYLHRVGRAGRFGTKGLAISFVGNAEEKKVLDEVQSRFETKVEPMPDTIDPALYMHK